MNITDFFSDPLHAEIAMLIVVSSLSEEEKTIWFETLPVMTAPEKTELRDNLREEVRVTVEGEGKLLAQLNSRIQEFFAS